MTKYMMDDDEGEGREEELHSGRRTNENTKVRAGETKKEEERE